MTVMRASPALRIIGPEYGAGYVIVQAGCDGPALIFDPAAGKLTLLLVYVFLGEATDVAQASVSIRRTDACLSFRVYSLPLSSAHLKSGERGDGSVSTSSSTAESSARRRDKVPSASA